MKYGYVRKMHVVSSDAEFLIGGKLYEENSL